MTPKEKAEKLTDSFLTASFGVMEEYVPVPYEFAKQCALIAVDEILNALSYKVSSNFEELKYFEEVKQEIKKL